MEIIEARNKKVQLETDIMLLIDKFEKDTDLKIMYISISRADLSCGKDQLVGLNITTELS